MNYRVQAKATLADAEIKIGQDFDSLDKMQKTAIAAEAASVHGIKYRTEMTEEFVRKRYALLQKRASRF